MTQTISLIALAVFAAGMIIIGMVSSKHVKSLDGFLMGGRKVGPWMSAFAFAATYFSAVIFVGYAGTNGWMIGLSSMWIGVGNALIGCLLAWKLMAARTRDMTHALNARTMPEFFATRYLSRNMKIVAALIIFIFLMPYAASVYKGLGAFFSAVFPSLNDLIPGVSATVICMFIVALLTAIYLVMGGYVAIALTDFIQGLIMLGGVAALIVALTLHEKVGGLSNAIEQLKTLGEAEGLHLTDITGKGNRMFLMTNILLTSFGTFGLPQMVHKFYAVRDRGAIRRATVVSTLFAVVIGCGSYYIGSMGRLILDNKLPEGGTDSVVPTMLMTALSDGLMGNVLLSLTLLLVLSASMSTLSSVVLSASTALTVDLWQVVGKKASDKSQVLATRVVCLIFVTLSFMFATFDFAIIVSIMSFSWGAVAGSFIGPFVWGLFSKKITRTGAWFGMAGGLCTLIIMTLVATLTQPMLATDGLYLAFRAASKSAPLFGVCAMGASVVLTPVVSLFTRKLPSEHLEKAFVRTMLKAK